MLTPKEHPTKHQLRGQEKRVCDEFWLTGGATELSSWPVCRGLRPGGSTSFVAGATGAKSDYLRKRGGRGWPKSRCGSIESLIKGGRCQAPIPSRVERSNVLGPAVTPCCECSVTSSTSWVLAQALRQREHHLFVDGVRCLAQLTC